MSLFGDDNASPPSTSRTPNGKPSLFASNSPPTSGGGGMFGDSGGAPDDSSPWGFTPTKRKPAHSSSPGNDNNKKNYNGSASHALATTLLSTDLPYAYAATFTSLLASPSDDKVSVSACRRILGPPSSSTDRIWGLLGGERALSRGEFYVLMALVGLRQQEGDGEEEEGGVGLDDVDGWVRAGRTLPVPRWNGEVNSGGPVVHDGGFGGDSDPWASGSGGSPILARNYANGGTTIGRRTTSTFTTAANNAAAGAGDISDGTGGFGSAGDSGTAGHAGSSAIPWASGGNLNSGGFGGTGDDEDPNGGGGFGSGSGHTSRPTPAIGSEETVTVTLLEEKEGVFLFQHRNYEVSTRGGRRAPSRVVRRYSDFVWLLECLHRRYAFRALPLLPPKRVAINGNHLAADAEGFVEKRRRGLQRFANALVRHPVLREEVLVVMFLTVPTELSVWRKQASINIQEEFANRALPPGLEDSLPPNLPELFATVRAGVRRAADLYITLCTLYERLGRRQEGLAGEYGRIGAAWHALASEAHGDAYAGEDVSELNAGVEGTARGVEQGRRVLEDEARSGEAGGLEDLKTMRDALVSMREMFDRREKGARDTIPALEKRIMANEAKLRGIQAKGDQAKAGEAERVGEAIVKVRILICRALNGLEVVDGVLID
ncbi:hypothetical protein M433DRAFT_153581 [Acidomyces richmondensis BFW]|nr:MAG: hypothetical protein FE78DRAFT_89254 [Acidomyces sp. 'richmondensis']KYG46276.1 hypothetical protein M433DRAFT_153581 [Acidomyces richmondensis BFW]